MSDDFDHLGDAIESTKVVVEYFEDGFPDDDSIDDLIVDIPESKTIKCKRCGKSGLTWVKIFNGWRLAETENGAEYGIHYCNDKATATAEWIIMLHVRCPQCEESFDLITPDFWNNRAPKSIDKFLFRSNQKVRCKLCNHSFLCNFEHDII